METVLRFLIDHFPDLMDINLTASIVIVFVICVRQFLKKAPKIFSYALWGIVLLRLLVPVSIESPMSFVPERTEFSSMVEVNEVLPEIHFETPQDRADNEWYRENTPPGQPLAQVSRVLTAQDYLTFVWLFGIAVMLLYSVVSYWKLRHKLKVVVPYRKGIFIADDIDSPFVMGIFCPTIYLPGSLEPWERTFIIAHERHHIRRGDHIFKALGFLALTIHWFNPFVWAAFALAGRDMEMSCDEAVIRKLGEDVRADYSASLLNLSTGHRMFAGTPLAFGEGNPTGRVRNLSKWKKPAVWVILICLIICIVLAVCLLTDPQIPEPKLTITFLELDTNNVTDIILQNNHNGEMTFISDEHAINEICSIIKSIGGINGLGGRHHYEGSYSLTLKDGSKEIFSIQFGDTDAFFYGIDDDGYAIRYELQGLSIDGIIRLLSPYDTSDFQWDFLQESETEQQILESDWNVSINPDRVSRTGATALFVYSGSIPGEKGAELTYGDFLSLDRLVDGEWVPVDELAGYNYFVGDSSYPVVDGYGMVHEWPDRFGELADGHYRLGKQVTLVRQDGSIESRMVYGEFFLPESVRTGLIPLNELPEKYSAEQAMIDGCFVQVDGIARENLDLFQNFAENASNGVSGAIRIVNWYYGDDSHWNAMDLSYDGTKYTLKSQYSIDGKNIYSFRYLKHFEVVFDELSAYSCFVLTDDKDLTWQEAEAGNGWTVYSSYTYAPRRPKLPKIPAQAVLEFNGEQLVTITDFDRLEKIWILFEEAELLGYEPKTHSIGVGLNLILKSQSGETMTIELDPDSDICRINGEYIFYGTYDEPDYIEKLWYYLGITAWPDSVYEVCSNAYRP